MIISPYFARKLFPIQTQLALMVDVGQALKDACYMLEGDGPLVLHAFEIMGAVKVALNAPPLYNTHAVIDRLVLQPNPNIPPGNPANIQPFWVPNAAHKKVYLDWVETLLAPARDKVCVCACVCLFGKCTSACVGGCAFDLGISWRLSCAYHTHTRALTHAHAHFFPARTRTPLAAHARSTPTRTQAHTNTHTHTHTHSYAHTRTHTARVSKRRRP
jgi:hypothetical protein